MKLALFKVSLDFVLSKHVLSQLLVHLLAHLPRVKLIGLLVSHDLFARRRCLQRTFQYLGLVPGSPLLDNAFLLLQI